VQPVESKNGMSVKEADQQQQPQQHSLPQQQQPHSLKQLQPTSANFCTGLLQLTQALNPNASHRNANILPWLLHFKLRELKKIIVSLSSVLLQARWLHLKFGFEEYRRK